MIVAALAMMVLALAALLMVILTWTDADQENAEEPVVPQRDGLPRFTTTWLLLQVQPR
jgi:hypothetical protein